MGGRLWSPRPHYVYGRWDVAPAQRNNTTEMITSSLKRQQPLLAAAAAAAKLLQSCPTLCNPTDGSPPGSPVPGILQARTLEWVAISFPNAWKWKVKVKSLSHVWPSATPWTAAFQAPPSMGVLEWGAIAFSDCWHCMWNKWVSWVVGMGESRWGHSSLWKCEGWPGRWRTLRASCESAVGEKRMLSEGRSIQNLGCQSVFSQCLSCVTWGE